MYVTELFLVVKGLNIVSLAVSWWERREDGRSNYAWDLEALNLNLMTYSRFGDR